MVFIVSSYVPASWLMQAIMTVFVFPPRESLSSRVSLESRYGINFWTPFAEKLLGECWELAFWPLDRMGEAIRLSWVLLVVFLHYSESMFMHWPRASSDLLIRAPSTILYPLFSVLAALSLPARSTIWSLERTNLVSVSSFDRPSILKIRIAWDLELNLFAPVLATILLWFPSLIRSMRSEASATGTSWRFYTTTPFIGSSTILRLWAGLLFYMFFLVILKAVS